MKILNLGSLNLDYTYAINHFVSGGETLAAQEREEHMGGKGLNQSIALARAGAEVYHAGHIGPEGRKLKDYLKSSGVDVTYIDTVDCPTGHAIIQVNPQGQNCIILYGGANQTITGEDVDRYLSNLSAGDILLLQNETSGIEHAITEAYKRGITIVLNPSPIDRRLIESEALKLVTLFIMNEVEGFELTGEMAPDKICFAMRRKYPDSRVVLTLGEKGSVYYDGGEIIAHAACKVKAVDTTAAGDTYTGFFLAGISKGESVAQAIDIASKASAVAVCSPGAGESIPDLKSVCEYPFPPNNER